MMPLYTQYTSPAAPAPTEFRLAAQAVLCLAGADTPLHPKRQALLLPLPAMLCVLCGLEC
jgi:hypothetical protein